MDRALIGNGFLVFLFFFSANLSAQTEYNPSVSSPAINPASMDNVECEAPPEPIERIDCFLGTSFAIVYVTSPRGAGYEYRLDDGNYTDNPVFAGVRYGNHRITVRDISGCTTTGDEFSVSCGCVNAPIINLSSESGSVCGITSLTVSGNTFGGSATSVTITENGSGIISNPSVTTSPFSFTYIPGQGDRGKTITITFTSNNPAGATCVAAVTAYRLNVNPVPNAPLVGNIVHPGCNTSIGSVSLSGLPGTGSWTLVRYPGMVTSVGTGTHTTVTGLNSGTYNFTVKSQSGCTSPLSGNAVVNQQPSTPSVPVAGTITAPTCPDLRGSVALSGLPSNGSWTINSIPAGTTLTGRGTSTTIQGLAPGTYRFNVTNNSGCISGNTGNVIIPPVPGLPVLVINNPIPVCFPSTVDLTASEITAGSAPALTFTYWVNSGATRSYGNPKTAGAGTYYIKAVNSAQCSDIKPVNVVVLQQPYADAGPDQVLEFDFKTITAAVEPADGESGQWSIISGSGYISDPSSSKAEITNLEIGENFFAWTVSNIICPETSDTLKITVNDLEVSTLITPNEDGRNDYFLLKDIEDLPGNELIIFDRRGIMVYKAINYGNDWNGIDYNGKQLLEGTYFYILNSGNGRQKSGYLVIRR